MPKNPKTARIIPLEGRRRKQFSGHRLEAPESGGVNGSASRRLGGVDAGAGVRGGSPQRLGAGSASQRLRGGAGGKGANSQCVGGSRGGSSQRVGGGSSQRVGSDSRPLGSGSQRLGAAGSASQRLGRGSANSQRLSGASASSQRLRGSDSQRLGSSSDSRRLSQRSEQANATRISRSNSTRLPGSVPASEGERRVRSGRSMDLPKQARSVSEARSAEQSVEGRGIEMPESRKAIREAKRKARRKAKAEKAYNKAYGADGAGSNNPRKAAGAESGSGSGSEGGPRAALYKGKMGSSQKKSSKMQSKSKAKSSKPAKAKGAKPEGAGKVRGAAAAAVGKVAAVGSKAASVQVPDKAASALKRFQKPLIALGALLLIVVALYGPAQQYYVQMRETDRLEAEYAAVAQRNDSLQSEIDSLKTDEGVEDRAHEELGYVMSGEETATVKGIEIEDDSEGFSSNVVAGSVPAPETWYSPVLDVLFGYSG